MAVRKKSLSLSVAYRFYRRFNWSKKAVSHWIFNCLLYFIVIFYACFFLLANWNFFELEICGRTSKKISWCSGKAHSRSSKSMLLLWGLVCSYEFLQMHLQARFRALPSIICSVRVFPMLRVPLNSTCTQM